MSAAMTSIAAGLVALMLSLPAAAEPAIPPGGDCALARDPLRCQALLQARSACKEKRGSGRQNCIQEKLSAADCSRDTARCESRQLAAEACQGKVGKARQSCLKDMSVASGRRTPAK